MEFEEGSLANHISGMKSPTVSTDSKLFDNVGEGKEVNIKLQAVQKHKKEKVKRKITEDNSSVRQNKIQKLTNKIDAENVEPVAVKSNAVKCLQDKKKKEAPLQSNEIEKDREARTIFVGNVPIDISRKKLLKLFNRYGKVDAVRIRCPPLADPRVPKKVAVIRKNFHPSRNSVHAYVRFVEIESAQKALAVNGRDYQGHHIRVDMASAIADHDPKKSVFIGNVPFAAEEDDLWEIFKSCGNISSIRLIRDGKTGMGKGFGYINFETADAVELALKLCGAVLNKRELRIGRCFNKPKPRNISGNRKGKTFGKNRNQELKMSSSKTKSNEEDNINIKEDVEDDIKGDDDKQDVVNVPDSDERSKKTVTKSQQAFSVFQGQKMTEDKKLRKKMKKKRARLRKNAMIRKLAPKSQSAIKEVKKPVLKTVITKED